MHLYTNEPINYTNFIISILCIFSQHNIISCQMGCSGRKLYQIFQVTFFFIKNNIFIILKINHGLKLNSCTSYDMIHEYKKIIIIIFLLAPISPCMLTKHFQKKKKR